MRIPFKSFLYLCLIVFSSDLFGQKILCEISTGNNLADFTAVAYNDSVLISFVEIPQSGNRYKRTRWLRSDGTFRNDNLMVDVFAIQKFDDEVYYYFFSGKKEKLLLKAIVEKPEFSSRKESVIELPVAGMLIGSKLSNNLSLLFFDEEVNQFTILEIRGLKVISERKYSLPEQFSKYVKKPSDVELFTEQSELNTFKGWSKVKVYWYNNVYIAIDEPAISGNTKRAVQTQVYLLNDEHESNEVIVIPEESRDDFRSYILDKKLFRSVVSKTKFTLSVYDLDSKELLGREEILKGQATFNTYFRYGRENRISKNETIDIMIRTAGLSSPSLNVLKDSSGYLIQWGLYFNDKGMQGPAGMASLAGLLVMTVGTAIKQMNDGPGVSRYFYYSWSSDTNKFSFNDSPNTNRSKLDAYEIAMGERKAKVTMKNYIEFRDGLLGIYYEFNKEKATIVQFQ